MSDIRNQENIEELRRRLYARGPEANEVERHALTDRTVDVARNWGGRTAPQPGDAAEVLPSTPETQSESSSDHIYSDDIVVEAPVQPKRRYRVIVLAASFAVFILGVGVSTAFLFLGGNKISSDFINLNITGPATIGSGDTVSLQIGITNQNSVAIEAATLVLKYPNGSRTINEPVKTLYEERIPVDTLGAGEVKNIPIQVAVFGKENEQKEILATLEYRLKDSNGMFFKEAEPMRFLITSSPLNLQITSIRKVAAGQPFDVTVQVTSNSNQPLKDILISAAYPNGFSFQKSEPTPIYNQNTWKIDELKPGESEKITIRGSITGHTEETFGMTFSAGQADTDNQFIVASLLNDAHTEFVIEHPFIDVGIEINGDADESVVLEPNRTSPVTVTVKNTLDESVYDMVVEVVPKGNALSAESISSGDGFYDSNKGLVRWDGATEENFAQVNPGEERRLDFTISPKGSNSTASFDLTVNVYARRVAEASAQEQLIGTVNAEARYTSELSIGGEVGHMTGPVPPKVGQATTYLITLAATSGGNEVTNAALTSSLPTYVEWQNDFNGPGSVNYNPVTKQLEWKIGDLDANSTKELVFSVSILPSVSQVGITPVLLNEQQLTATDRFTNTEKKTNHGTITTTLSAEAGYTEGNGKVSQ